MKGEQETGYAFTGDDILRVLGDLDDILKKKPVVGLFPTTGDNPEIFFNNGEDGEIALDNEKIDAKDLASPDWYAVLRHEEWIPANAGTFAKLRDIPGLEDDPARYIAESLICALVDDCDAASCAPAKAREFAKKWNDANGRIPIREALAEAALVAQFFPNAGNYLRLEASVTRTSDAVARLELCVADGEDYMEWPSREAHFDDLARPGLVADFFPETTSAPTPRQG